MDAAIATQLALAVVYPGAGNLGGGGFLVGYLAGGKTLAIDYREKAPGKAHRDMYLDPVGNAITNLSQDGHLAAGVPGTVAGLFTSAKYGRAAIQRSDTNLLSSLLSTDLRSPKMKPVISTEPKQHSSKTIPLRRYL